MQTLLFFQIVSTRTLDLLDTLQGVVESADGTGLVRAPFLFRQTPLHFLDHHHHIFVGLAPIQLLTEETEVKLYQRIPVQEIFFLSAN